MTEKKQPEAYFAKLSDFRQLRDNPNAGSERGQYMLEVSAEKFGAWRSVAATADGVIAAGNHFSEVFGEKNADEDVIVVKTNGKQLVIVQREDISSDDPRATEYAIADNRTSEVGLTWDAEIMQAVAEMEGVNLDAFFHEDELSDMFNAVPSLDDLAEQYGDSEPDDFWPVIRARVSTELYAIYQQVTDEFGSTDDERISGLLRQYADLSGPELS